ncbi:MAG: hypothetical protein ACE37H_03610 [Phycisphaeraceae bacterium]
MARQAKKQGKPKKRLSWKARLAVGAIFFLPLSALLFLAALLIPYAGTGPVAFGSRNESGARSYMEEQLDAWRGGNGTDLVGTTSTPVLVSYEIVDIEERRLDVLIYRFNVQLEFSTRGGGRPVELHGFLARWNESDGVWKVTDDSRYMAVGRF